MPELFGSFRPGVELGGLKFNLLNFGYNHQSNGRADPISRSWDRLFVEGGLESERLRPDRARLDAHPSFGRRGRQPRHHGLYGAWAGDRACTGGATTRSR